MMRQTINQFGVLEITFGCLLLLWDFTFLSVIVMVMGLVIQGEQPFSNLIGLLIMLAAPVYAISSSLSNLLHSCEPKN